MSALLTVEGVTMRFGGLVAVNNVGFSLAKGAVLSVIGPNGAGKSTLFNVITGVYKPTAGTVAFAGASTTAMPESAGRWLNTTVLPPKLPVR